MDDHLEKDLHLQLQYQDEYTIWEQMIQRCTNPQWARGRSWHRYGGRGIKVCRRWKNSFTLFLLDVGKRPSGTHGRRPKYTLGRKDNDGNYEPRNVEWQTWKEQNNNRCR